VTLFPRTFADASALFGQPDTVLVVAGTLDMRAGQLQIRADAIKKASLSTMIQRAKEEGFFDANEVGLQRTREVDEEKIEMVDEEGNVIAGEVVTVGKETAGEDFLGPLGRWIVEGMKTDDVMKDSDEKKIASESSKSLESSPLSSRISIHTIELPARAPRQLLLDLKRTFETFPGRERVQLKIGGQIVPVPLTITMSTILEKKIEEIMGKYATPAA
jgi:hypothetical protein